MMFCSVVRCSQNKHLEAFSAPCAQAGENGFLVMPQEVRVGGVAPTRTCTRSCSHRTTQTNVAGERQKKNVVALIQDHENCHSESCMRVVHIVQCSACGPPLHRK